MRNIIRSFDWLPLIRVCTIYDVAFQCISQYVYKKFTIVASPPVVTKSKTLLDERRQRTFCRWHPFPSQLPVNILGNTMRAKCFGNVLYYPASSEPTSSRSHISVSNVFCFHQVSYSPMASDLSNKDKFPLLYSTVSPYSAENAARLAFLRHFRWKRIATIRQNEYVFNEVLNGFCPVKCRTFRSNSSQKSHLSFARWTKAPRMKYKQPDTFL